MNPLKTFSMCFAIVVLVACKKSTDDKMTAEETQTTNKIENTKNNFTTYCNPLDIDYSYMSHYRANNNVS